MASIPLPGSLQPSLFSAISQKLWSEVMLRGGLNLPYSLCLVVHLSLLLPFSGGYAGKSQHPPSQTGWSRLKTPAFHASSSAALKLDS